MRFQDVIVGDVVEILATSGAVQGQDTVVEKCEPGLESQVVALRAELQKVGKQTQNGSRFALLELD